MYKTHAKNAVRYYVLLTVLLLFLFISNDFGMIDVQKTALVTAAGVDRENGAFVVTSQISIPQASKEGQSSQTVQLVSRGDTVAEAFEQINAKTGWYPKLVFCDLIVLGESVVRENAFDALDFFLRDEYLSDACALATCDGSAQKLLNTAALVDASSGQAIGKVLSPHAERVGTVLPSTLREFSIGYFSDSRCGYLPILKIEPQQEKGNDSPENGSESPENGSESGENGGSESSSGGSSEGGASAQTTPNKPVFSARETALFVDGRRVERLNDEETFAVGSALHKLRLASVRVGSGKTACTLSVKQNAPKIRLYANSAESTLRIDVTFTAGVLDYSTAQGLENFTDAGNVAPAYFRMAERQLTEVLLRAYEKCRLCNADIFGVQERLLRYAKRGLRYRKDEIFRNTTADVRIRFQNVR